MSTGQVTRVETGIVQFDDDWPGIFIRGDNAFFWGMALKEPRDDSVSRSMIASLSKLLLSADVRKHKKRDVQRIRTTQ